MGAQLLAKANLPQPKTQHPPQKHTCPVKINYTTSALFVTELQHIFFNPTEVILVSCNIVSMIYSNIEP